MDWDYGLGLWDYGMVGLWDGGIMGLWDGGISGLCDWVNRTGIVDRDFWIAGFIFSKLHPFFASLRLCAK